jgi:hypothetical protein
MKTLAFLVMILGLLLTGSAVAEESGEAVPKSYDGAGDTLKEGGREIGEGFKSLGRGLKRTFTGEESKQEYKGTKNIGEGFKDVGRGVAGGARAVGRSVKDGGDGDEDRPQESK